MRCAPFRFTTGMSDESAPPERPHGHLSDDELLAQLHVHRRETTEWATAMIEIQHRADRLHSDERFRAALELADDGIARSDPPAA